MEAAVPVMVFSGVLHTEMGYGHSVEQLFSKLNRTMHSIASRRKGSTAFGAAGKGRQDLAELC
jgi:regulator of sirC expression with transglutaminase-like and TPR domain